MNTEVNNEQHPCNDLTKLLARVAKREVPIDELIEHSQQIFSFDGVRQQTPGEVDEYCRRMNLSSVTYSKLKKIGSKAYIFRSYIHHLPTAIGPLHALACKSPRKLYAILQNDVSAKSVRQIIQLGQEGIPVVQIMQIFAFEDCDPIHAARIVAQVQKLLAKISEDPNCRTLTKNYVDARIVSEEMASSCNEENVSTSSACEKAEAIDQDDPTLH